MRCVPVRGRVVGCNPASRHWTLRRQVRGTHRGTAHTHTHTHTHILTYTYACPQHSRHLAPGGGAVWCSSVKLTGAASQTMTLTLQSTTKHTQCSTGTCRFEHPAWSRPHAVDGVGRGEETNFPEWFVLVPDKTVNFPNGPVPCVESWVWARSACHGFGR